MYIIKLNIQSKQTLGLREQIDLQMWCDYQIVLVSAQSRKQFHS